MNRPPQAKASAIQPAAGLGRADLFVEPSRGIVKEEAGDGERPVERVAEQLLACEYARQRDLLPGDDRETPDRCVGHRAERVGSRDLEWELDAPDSCQVDCEAK